MNDDFCVHQMLNEITVYGETVRVTVKQVDIAQLLFERHPKPVSLTSIQHVYWGIEEWGEKMTVLSQISRLRTSLKNTRLKIKHGQDGYRFELLDKKRQEKGDVSHD